MTADQLKHLRDKVGYPGSARPVQVRGTLSSLIYLSTSGAGQCGLSHLLVNVAEEISPKNHSLLQAKWSPSFSVSACEENQNKQRANERPTCTPILKAPPRFIPYSSTFYPLARIRTVVSHSRSMDRAHTNHNLPRGL